jgi:hypothetical protein
LGQCAGNQEAQNKDKTEMKTLIFELAESGSTDLLLRRHRPGVTLAETLNWSWSQFWKRTIAGLIVGIFLGYILCFVAPTSQPEPITSKGLLAAGDNAQCHAGLRADQWFGLRIYL